MEGGPNLLADLDGGCKLGGSKSAVTPAWKIVMRGHSFWWCECKWKKTFEKEADQIVTLCISFRSAQSEFEATFTFTDAAKVNLFTAENGSSSKTSFTWHPFGCNHWLWAPSFGVFYSGC